MGYKQELQIKQNEAKGLLKSLKKQRSKVKKEDYNDVYSLQQIDRKIEKANQDIRLLTPSKHGLYKLSNGKIVNLKILKPFIKKLKNSHFTAFQETEEGLVFGYSAEGSCINGKLTFYALPELFTTLKGIPEFNKEEWF